MALSLNSCLAYLISFANPLWTKDKPFYVRPNEPDDPSL
jgi:hypothetical protein